MNATLPVQLRAFSLGELLDQVIRLFRRNFVTFIGIIALVQVPLSLLQIIVSLLTFGSGLAGLTDPTQLPTETMIPFAVGASSSVLVTILSFILVQGVATAALTRAIGDNYLGEPVDIFSAYRKIGRSWVSLLGAILLAALVSTGLAIWFMIPCIGWATGFGILMFFSLVIVPLIAPIIILERQPAAQAINRAWALARRRFWWVLGFVVILFIFGQLIVTGPTVLATLLLQSILGPAALSDSPTITFAIQTSIQSVVTLIFSLIYLPLQLTGITLMYFDLRIRTEGFDLAVLAESLSEKRSELVNVAAQTPAPEGFSVTASEMGNFVLASVVGGVGFAILVAILGAFGMAALAGAGGF